MINQKTRAQAAARKIMLSARRGQSRRVLALPARLAALARGVSPAPMQHILVMSALLPADAAADSAGRPGAASYNRWSGRWLRPAIERAGSELNQPAAPETASLAENQPAETGT